MVKSAGGAGTFCTSDTARSRPGVRVLVVLLSLWSAVAFARTPHNSTQHNSTPRNTDSDHVVLDHRQFLREYALGVQRLPMDGGKMYGWKINDRVTFGRFKGENDEFGFSFEVDKRQRVEITTDGLRWRRAVGGH